MRSSRPFLVALILAVATPLRGAQADPLGPVSPPSSPELDHARALSRAFADVAEAVSGAVVYIEARKGPQVAAGLEELMRDYQLPGPPGRGSGGTSTGSGVFISPDGLVLTNHHVVAGASAPMVTLRDQRRYPAEVVGSDARTDLALLRVLGEGPFPWAELGDSDAVGVGQWVIAVGHPFEFQFTVTTGIISARGRRNLFRNEIQDYLQTDAAVNPGSSGGPLFDLDGRVVGINTAIYTPPGGGTQNAGISFAIPSNMAAKVRAELLNTGRVARASLGITTRDRPASPSQPRPGAEVTRVTPRSPAEDAGLRRGDVVFEVDGEPISGSDDLRALVQARGVHVALRLRWLRGDDVLDATLETRDEDDLPHPDVTIPADAIEWAGMTLGAALPEARLAFGVDLPDRQWAGVMVYAVAPGSPAAAAGIEAGDVLLDAGELEIRTPDHLVKLAEGRRTLTIRFWREGGESWAAVGGLRSAAP